MQSDQVSWATGLNKTMFRLYTKFMFFDSKPVISFMEKKERAVLSRFIAFVRRTVRSSITIAMILIRKAIRIFANLRIVFVEYFRPELALPRYFRSPILPIDAFVHAAKKSLRIQQPPGDLIPFRYVSSKHSYSNFCKITNHSKTKPW